MTANEFVGSANINNDGIKKHFKNYEPWEAISELIWNGFDARAKSVDVSIQRNDLDAAISVSVVDSGDGIDFPKIDTNFGNFNDSLKKTDVSLHGSHGRGRLAFYKLGQSAKWWTRFEGRDARIEVFSNDIKRFKGVEIDASEQCEALKGLVSGTQVEILNITENLPIKADLEKKLADEFGWYLICHKDRVLRLESEPIKAPQHELSEKAIDAAGTKVNLSVVRWEDRPFSEKSMIYLVNSQGKVVYQELSSLNKKANFFTSVYVTTEWADKFSAEDGLFTDADSSASGKTWRAISKELSKFTLEIYEAFLRKYVDEQIDAFVRDGIFPDYKNENPQYAQWKLNHTKSLIKAVYLADPTIFSTLSKKQRKIIVRLLDRMSVANEDEKLFDILEGVLDLDHRATAMLAAQLKHTRLENIIATIDQLQQRQIAVDKLRHIMNVHYATVLETPDLQKIIENNTWLFGPQYQILGAEEDTFTKIVRKFRDELKDVNKIEEGDVEGEASVAGASKQTDLFLARKIKQVDSAGKPYFKCVVIEIKRPSVSLNKKHLRQLEDYAEILGKYSDFNSAHMRFDLILIGRKISAQDTEITGRMSSQMHRGEQGLVMDDGRMKRYVKSWATIFDEFSLANAYMLEKLQIERDSYEAKSKSELVSELQGA